MVTLPDAGTHAAQPDASSIDAVLIEPVRPRQLFDCLANLRRPAVFGTNSPVSENTNAKSNSYAMVLIAEDNLTNQQVVAGMLNILDCEADVVANGREALMALSRHPYDLILMDCQMPEMDGFEATEVIRREEASSGSAARAIIIALTANAMEGDRERCLAAGMDDFLSKPFTIEQLRGLLEQWLPWKIPGPAQPPEERSDEGSTSMESQPGSREASADAEEKGSQKAAFPAEPPVPDKIPRFNGRVLVVDDSQLIQEVIINMLKRFGCQVEGVGSGNEALASMAQRHYDLVLMDYNMPGMDGCETVRRIRKEEAADPSKPHVPVIAITGGGESGQWELCLTAGMDDYLDKPFQLEQLQNMLERWLSKSPPDRDATPIRAAGETTIRLASGISGFQDNGAPAPSTIAACLDPEALKNLRALQLSDAPDLFGTLVETYLHESPRLLERLRDAILREDLESASRAAHSLKSSSAVLGATRFAALCIEMEALAERKTLDPVKEMLPEILGEFERVRQALLEEIRL
ncbi:MAG: response regulator [Pseudomonadota bacterium]